MRTAVIAGLLAGLASAVQAVDIVVKSKGGNKTTHMPYGLMHEDINYSGDGGLYAELIRNRAFQGSDMYPVSLAHWSSVNGAVLSIKNLSEPLSSALPSSMNVAVSKNSSSGDIGFLNAGYWGMDVRRQKYKGSFYVKGDYKGSFTASFQSALTNDTFGSVEIKSKAKKDEWVQHSFTLIPKKDAPNGNNTFALTFKSSGVKGGSLDFNLISVFPPTYKGRENGLRIDIAEPLAATQPRFLRFPGGNALEGPDINNPWKWNETIGPLKNRPGRPGVWGYQTSDGLGLVEYLQWAEDMNLEPILGVWAGLALNGEFLTKEELGPWVQDALDEIEFIRGPVSSPMGKLRASLGHPKPWPLRYVEIGNEDWLAGAPASYDAYKEYRFPMFAEAISTKYPDIQIIASPSVYDNMTIPAPYAGDYHPYREPDNFYNEFHKFDSLTKDNKTLVGEFSSTHANGGIKWAGQLHPFPWWIGSVAEGIFMIGAERNGDRILGSTYAPMIRNMNSWSWSICMIEYEADARKTSLATSYYTFKFFSTRPIFQTLPTTPDEGNTTSLFWGAGVGEDGEKIVKFANYNTTSSAPTPVKLSFDDEDAKEAKLTMLTGTGDPYAYNEPLKPNRVVKETSRTLRANRKGLFEFEMPELSVAVVELTGRRGGGGRGHPHGRRV
ncbi:glycoside hydrolase family 51 protein [Sporormia fimetaria CBS 119925]|uniref:non-reducing end alpha-L-arabinofuranosidase n=1 Tax=Sporormia fimetaria CBS 119925 TaxID=1340428 RepID=A0A6A6UZL9_9PLEO|nr:glycoside hydrolase family 51 protein [Sporormia fimetaria CBS 119925]